jgi:hypothetical protein
MAQHKFKGIGTEQINKAMRSPEVMKSLEARAARILPRTRALAYAANQPLFARALRVETGVRPGTQSQVGVRRSYARVTATLTPQILAESRRAVRAGKPTRQMILRRGAA